MSNYPEHDKQAKVIEDAGTIGEFLEWLQSDGTHLMVWRTDMTDMRQCTGSIYPARDCPGEGCDRCGGEGFYEITGIEMWVDDRRSINALLADFFGIDLTKLNAEKAQMLADIRGES
jgi:hypothetical protein